MWIPHQWIIQTDSSDEMWPDMRELLYSWTPDSKCLIAVFAFSYFCFSIMDFLLCNCSISTENSEFREVRTFILKTAQPSLICILCFDLYLSCLIFCSCFWNTLSFFETIINMWPVILCEQTNTPQSKKIDSKKAKHFINIYYLLLC